MIRICKFLRQLRGFCDWKMNWCMVVLLVLCLKLVNCHGEEKETQGRDLASWAGSWTMYPTTASWSLQTRIPMTSDFADTSRGVGGQKGKYRKRFKKYLLPLLLAYKLKFFTLIPVLLGGLVLLTGATGLAGFFFALFAAVMGLKSSSH